MLRGDLDSNLVIEGGSAGLPVVSGGKVLSGGWTERSAPDGSALWVRQTNASEPFSKLYHGIGGGEYSVSRLPRNTSEFLRWEAPLANCSPTSPASNAFGFRFRAGDILPSWNLSDAAVCTFASWDAQWRSIASIDWTTRSLRFNEAMAYPVGSEATNSGRRYAVENVYPPQAPGQWHRSASGLVSYRPRPGEDIRSFAPIAPQRRSVFVLDGVENVSLRGLAIRHGSDGGNRNAGRTDQPSLINISYSRDIKIVGCELTAGGGGGISISGRSASITVRSSYLHDLGGDGVTIGETRVDELRRRHDSNYTVPTPVDVEIANSVISHIGQVFLLQPSGISIGGTRVTVTACDISFSPYAGITGGTGNSITRSHIHDYGFLLSDLGGVYIAGQRCSHAGDCPLDSTHVSDNIIRRSNFFAHGGNGV